MRGRTVGTIRLESLYDSGTALKDYTLYLAILRFGFRNLAQPFANASPVPANKRGKVPNFAMIQQPS